MMDPTVSMLSVLGIAILMIIELVGDKNAS